MDGHREAFTALSFMDPVREREEAMILPSLEEVEALGQKGTVIPIHKDVLGDLFTPAAAFLRVAHGRRRVFLLESVEGGERLARYSFIGWDPFLTVRGKGEPSRPVTTWSPGAGSGPGRPPGRAVPGCAVPSKRAARH